MLARWIAIIFTTGLLSSAFFMADLSQNVRVALGILGGVGLIAAINPQLKARR